MWVKDEDSSRRALFSFVVRIHIFHFSAMIIRQADDVMRTQEEHARRSAERSSAGAAMPYAIAAWTPSV